MKLRWIAHINGNIPTLAYAHFVEPEKDPYKIKLKAQIMYIPEADAYTINYMSKDGVSMFGEGTFKDIPSAMQAAEQYLFEEGIREDA